MMLVNCTKSSVRAREQITDFLHQILRLFAAIYCYNSGLRYKEVSMLQNRFSYIATLKVASVLLLLSGVNTAVAQTIFKDSFEQPVAITSFSASATAIMQGQSTTISWTTVAAISCTPSGGAGDWVATEIDLPDGSAQIQFPEAGDFTFTLTCAGLTGDKAFANFVVSASPVPAEITSFSASPDVIAEGDLTTLSWTTNFASSCIPSDGVGEWSGQSIVVPDGSVQIIIPAADTYTFTLTCIGAVGDPAVASDIVTVSPAVAITKFVASLTSIAENQITTFSWSTENAKSCTASNGAGGWSAEVLTLPSGTAQIAITTAGMYTFTMTCEGEAGDLAVASEDITVSAPAEITSFVASANEVAVGESLTLSWKTQNTTLCTPTGGADGWEAVKITLLDGTLPDGEAILDIVTEGEHTFTLTCDGVAGPAAVSNAVVTVTPDPNSCSSVPFSPYPSLWVRPWESFWQVAFPGPISGDEFLTIAQFGFHALEFNTANIVDDGKMTTIETTVTDGVRLGSISKCPGDFDVPDECQHIWGIGGGIRWATNGRAGACQLEPETTYYFNLTYTDGFAAESTTCNRSPCITNVQYDNRP